MKVLRAHGADLTEHRQLVSGKDFVLSAPDHVPAIAGRDREVWWAEGESLFIVGPPGVGKSTLLQQAALRRAGVLDGELIGFPVAADPTRLTLYLALDRPRQIARSLKRMVSDDRAQKLERLIVWTGPLPFNVVKEPEKLLLFVQDIGEMVGTPVGTVCIDSLKDMAAPLSSDEVGAAVNRAIGGLVAAEIQPAVNHHQRKATGENKKPRTLDDVYGSAWITAGAGSVVLLWGEPGDAIVELTHLKQPAEAIGPLTLLHDHDRGVTIRQERPDAWTVLQAATTGGTTVTDAAEAIYGSAPTKNQAQKVRRRLERFVAEGQAVRIEPSQKFADVLYRPVAKNGSVTTRDELRDGARGRPHSPSSPGNNRHAPVTHADSSSPYVVGGGERDESASDGHSIADAEAIRAEHKEAM
jgi:replicative DNA helicase